MKEVRLGLLCLLTGVVLTSCKKEDNGIIVDMVYVDGGTFMMGATSEQGSDAYDTEKPVHKVTLSPYYISKYEITQAQYKAVMGENPSRFSGDDLPVECVTWSMAVEFCEKLTAQTGKKYMLPTEAQWEFAARGGNKSKGYKYSGSNSINAVAWFDYNSDEKPHAVGTKGPNELGIYDMSGNVEEWCTDWKGNYNSADVTNPIGPSSGQYRVQRGGAYGLWSKWARVSYRDASYPDFCNQYTGFRVVCLP